MVKIATLAKPLALQTKNLTKEERRAREEAEEKIKGADNYILDEVIPTGLTKNQIKYYKFILDAHKGSGVLQNIDIITMLRLVKCLSYIERCEVELNKNLLDDSGAPTGYGKLYNQFTKQADSWMKQLCLSPTTRASLAKLVTESAQESDDILLKILSE